MAHKIPLIIAKLDFADGVGTTIRAFSPSIFFEHDNYGVQLQHFIDNMNGWIIANDFVLHDPNYHIRDTELPLADRIGSCRFSHSKHSLDVLDDSPIFFNWRQAAAYAESEPNIISRAVWHDFV